MNSTNPAVSIIMPAYKTEKYIGKCLDSAIVQDFKLPYEIIVVNDGSPDRVGEIAEQYAARYDFIHVINKDNGGISSARNAGVFAAEGDYIAFVDSDDYLQPDYLSKMYEKATETGADIVCCNFNNVLEGTDYSVKCVLKHLPGVYDSRRMLKSLLLDVTMRSYPWNKLYRRSIFTDNRILFPYGLKFEDAATMPKIFHFAKTVAVIDDHLYNYVRRPDSITGALKKSDVRDYIEYFISLRGFFEQRNIYRENRLYFYILRKKVSVTVLGMLIRCWISDRKNTHVWSNYKRARRVLKLCSTDKYYFADKQSLMIALK